jgi:hypothetical protein
MGCFGCGADVEDGRAVGDSFVPVLAACAAPLTLRKRTYLFRVTAAELGFTAIGAALGTVNSGPSSNRRSRTEVVIGGREAGHDDRYRTGTYLIYLV